MKKDESLTQSLTRHEPYKWLEKFMENSGDLIVFGDIIFETCNKGGWHLIDMKTCWLERLRVLSGEITAIKLIEHL